MPSRTSSARSRGSDILLDPYGIYGTRTANRMRATRRRRQSQNAVLLLLILGALAGGVAFAKLRRVAAVKPEARLELLSPVVAPPLRVHNEKLKRDFLLVASADGRLLRLDNAFEETGAPQVVLDAAFPLHMPFVKGNLAFVPCEDGQLYAVDWQSSKVLWKSNFHAPLTARPVCATLQVSAPAASPAASQTSVKVVADEPAASPGEAPAVEPQASERASQTVRREIVVAGSDDGTVAALDAGTGKPRWKVKLPAPPGDGLSVTSGATPRVYVPLLGSAFWRGGIWCLDGATGKVLWRFPRNGRNEATQLSPPAISEADGRLFFGNENGALFCLEARSGSYDAKKKIGWKAFVPTVQKHTESVTAWRTAPLLFFGSERGGASTRLVVGGSDGGVRSVASRSGELLWQFDAEAPIQGLQKLRAGERDLVLVCANAANLYLLDAKNGGVIRRFASHGLLAGAIATEDSVFAVTAEGVVERFPLRF